MYAIEFQTRIKNGVIEVPQEYMSKLREAVKVIILAEEDGARLDMIQKLLNSHLEVENFAPMKRDEIYGRK